MPKPIKILSVNDIQHAAAEATGRLMRWGLTDRTSPLTLYGVPRGGVTAAAFLAASLNEQTNCGGFAVCDPREADVIVDDLIDSGRTRENYKNHHPDKPFVALFYKPDHWLVFPWEASEEQSANDIPVRLLQYIGEQPNREGLADTPARFLKAWREWSAGYGVDIPAMLRTFEDGAEKYDELVIVRDIPVYSHCEHHLAPFFGKAHVAYIPSGRVVGLSKLARLVQAYAQRLQVQERLTQQVAHAL